MPTILTFDIDAVRELAEHAYSAKQHTPTFGQLLDPAFAKPGVVLEPETFLEPDQVDTSKVPPALLWVKDQGIYLMSNGRPGLMREHGKGHKVVYAAGFGPDADYQALKDAVGGDDFVEALTLDEDMMDLIRDPAHEALELHVTPEQFEVHFVVRPGQEEAPRPLH